MESDLYFLILNKSAELIHDEGAEADEFQVCSSEFFWVNGRKKPSPLIQHMWKTDWWSVWGEVHNRVDYIGLKFEPEISKDKVTNLFANVGLRKD